MIWRYTALPALALLLIAIVLQPVPLVAQSGVYYVATDGSDVTGDGSSAHPWATITHALNNIPDGSTVLVRPGTYTGRVRLRGSFVHGVTVRSELPYQARLRNNDRVITSYDGCRGITLEGFDVAHSGPGAGALVIHLDGGGQSGRVSRITLRNNLLHDSTNNDILKINNAAGQIIVEGNLFYNQSGSDEHIDVNSATDVIVQDNVFMNDLAVNVTSSFIVIKDSNDDDDGQLGSERIVVRRNVFLHWQGSPGQGFIRVGEDGKPYYEARDVLIENNLLLGDSANRMRAPFQVMNAYSVTIRANTVVGDLPAFEYGVRIFTYGAGAPTNDCIHLHNNIWSDPTGTMGDTFSRGGNTVNLTFDNNLFWNAGNPFPTSPESIVEVTDDAHRVIGDPLLGDPAGLTLPRWNPSTGQFADGSTTIRQVLERLVALYGAPAPGSPAIDSADPAHMPEEDILGRPRPVGAAPDIGAYERQEFGFTLSAAPAVRAVAPGGVATYTLVLVAVEGFSAPVTLTGTTSSPGLVLALHPSVAVPPAHATLTVTDTDGGPPLPGLWHTLPITATGGGITRTAQVGLLVGGTRLYLPSVLRQR